MLCKSVCNYISTAKGLPFFYVVGDEDYQTVLQELKQEGLEVVRVSDFCSSPERFPSIDELVDNFRTADVDFKSNKCVILGLGEYLALRGAEEADKVLRKLKSTTLGNARVVILLRGVAAQISNVISDDIRIQNQQRIFFSHNTETNIKIINLSKDLGVETQNGIQGLLQTMETGHVGTVLVSTDLMLDKSLFQVTSLTDSYALIKYYVKGFSFPKQYGSELFWSKLCKDLLKHNFNIDVIFETYGYNDDFDIDVYSKSNGYEYCNWIYFLALKYYREKITNSYLKYVVENTEDFNSFRNKIITAIIDISHLDVRHKRFYGERKKLVKDFPPEDIALFIHENEIDPQESIYNFTDNTLDERMGVINYIAKYGIPNNLEEIYPALAIYLKKYIFNCGPFSEELSEYFEEYKYQKLTNIINATFIEKVNKYAKSYKYTHLNTRDNIINSIQDKGSSILYWIDALGVEYLSYFVELSRQRGLAINIEIARADLPTITSINKGFYDSWTTSKIKFSELDELKHEESGGFNYENCKTPIHLAKELDLLASVISRASSDLAMHKCKKVVIASDHGASRLAVLHSQEEKYETDTKGEHSGRCCKVFDHDLENAIDENGYTVLADYGRFRGSRKSNVEVHGGASLEEVVVPIITLTLKTTSKIDIRVLNKDDIYADAKMGTTVQLYISDISNIKNVRMVVKDIAYQGVSIDNTHFTFLLSKVKRGGTYSAEIYDGDSLIGSAEIKVKGKTGSVKSDFDDLF